MTKVYDVNNIAAKSGRVIGEDGKVYNIVDLLSGLSGTGGVDLENYLTKDEIESIYQKKGNYATTTQVNKKANQTDVEVLQAQIETMQSQIDDLKAGGAVE